MNKVADAGVAFALHGGDLSYADDFTYGILPCIDDYHCYAGGDANTLFPAGYEDPIYKKPLPAGEIPDYGGPYGGDVSTIYESNWDLWQQWMNKLTTRIVRPTLRSKFETITNLRFSRTWSTPVTTKLLAQRYVLKTSSSQRRDDECRG